MSSRKYVRREVTSNQYGEGVCRFLFKIDDEGIESNNKERSEEKSNNTLYLPIKSILNP